MRKHSLLFACASLAFAGGGTPLAAQGTAPTVVDRFEQMCLAPATTLDERAQHLGSAPGFVSIPFPSEGALHKADVKLAWRGEIDGVEYLALLSSKTKSKSFSTFCELRSTRLVEVASTYAAAFEAAARRAGLADRERYDPLFYQFSGRLASGKRAHAKLTSALVRDGVTMVVRRGVAMVGSKTLSLSVIY